VCFNLVWNKGRLNDGDGSTRVRPYYANQNPRCSQAGYWPLGVLGTQYTDGIVVHCIYSPSQKNPGSASGQTRTSAGQN